MKLKIQLEDVDKALAGARIRRGVISAGYSQVIPSQPMAKKVLKTKRNTIPAIWYGLSSGRELTPARMAMVMAWPTAPNNISLRRPIRSTKKTAGHEARKYSVPFKAATKRDKTGDMPRSE